VPRKEIIGVGYSDPKAHIGQGKDLAAEFIALLLRCCSQIRLWWPDINYWNYTIFLKYAFC